MPFKSTRSPLILSVDVREQLSELARARSEPAQRVERARILLAFADGSSVSEIAREFRVNRPKVERCIDKALELGPLASLKDLPGRGRPVSIGTRDHAWVQSLACQKPKDLGYSYELWTGRLLALHVRKHCEAAGYPALRSVSQGTISKILTKSDIQPHKIRYYLEKRDPEFDAKMAQVLYVYKEVEVLREKGQGSNSLVAIISYDEKPGIQAIENTAPDLPPVPGKHPTVSRDHEYIRHGTLSLMAGIDLLNGRVHGIVVERHRSREFIDFLKLVDGYYPAGAKIRIVLDNHSAHTSKETRAYLATVPNRFEFTFTPKHGSWLNLIESFFGKMARSMLRGIRVATKAELKARIELYLKEVNEMPVIFRWKKGLEAISI